MEISFKIFFHREMKSYKVLRWLLGNLLNVHKAIVLRATTQFLKGSM